VSGVIYELWFDSAMKSGYDRNDGILALGLEVGGCPLNGVFEMWGIFGI
jgi:hypothetical protein